VQAIDTNILIFAEITTSTRHAVARDLLHRLAEGPLPWALPWPCAYEFLRVVTHPKVYHPPVPLPRALADLHRILEAPSVTLLSETERHPAIMEEVLRDAGVTGNLVHDAHIAALCLEHGVGEIITGDRDFARFSALRAIDPFR